MGIIVVVTHRWTRPSIADKIVMLHQERSWLRRGRIIRSDNLIVQQFIHGSEGPVRRDVARDFMEMLAGVDMEAIERR